MWGSKPKEALRWVLAPMQSFVILGFFLQWRWQWASIGHLVHLVFLFSTFCTITWFECWPWNRRTSSLKKPHRCKGIWSESKLSNAHSIYLSHLSITSINDRIKGDIITLDQISSFIFVANSISRPLFGSISNFSHQGKKTDRNWETLKWILISLLFFLFWFWFLILISLLFADNRCNSIS